MFSQQVKTLIPLMPKDEIWHSPISGLVGAYFEHPTTFESFIQEPSICIVLQGQRQICLGDQCLSFNQQSLMFCPVNIPLTMIVDKASPQIPYCSISLKIDLVEVRAILAELPPHSTGSLEHYPLKWDLDIALINAFQRLLDLHKSPEDIPFLSPLILREIYYRLLTGEQGQWLRSLLQTDSHTQRIAHATEQIKKHLAEPMRVEALAEECGMSVSGFHAHFKKVVGMSPLQYQKSLRLTTARQHLKAGQSNVSAIAFEVGYESASQFSREYKRAFGISPKGDC